MGRGWRWGPVRVAAGRFWQHWHAVSSGVQHGGGGGGSGGGGLGDGGSGEGGGGGLGGGGRGAGGGIGTQRPASSPVPGVPMPGLPQSTRVWPAGHAGARLQYWQLPPEVGLDASSPAGPPAGASAVGEKTKPPWGVGEGRWFRVRADRFRTETGTGPVDSKRLLSTSQVTREGGQRGGTQASPI